MIDEAGHVKKLKMLKSALSAKKVKDVLFSLYNIIFSTNMKNYKNNET